MDFRNLFPLRVTSANFNGWQRRQWPRSLFLLGGGLSISVTNYHHICKCWLDKKGQIFLHLIFSKSLESCQFGFDSKIFGNTDEESTFLLIVFPLYVYRSTLHCMYKSYKRVNMCHPVIWTIVSLLKSVDNCRNKITKKTNH